MSGDDGAGLSAHDGSPLDGKVGHRVVVTGLTGSGKSTFSKALSKKTGLPVVILDVHFWKPGWVEPCEEEWRSTQGALLAAPEWIADGNYYETLDFRLRLADTAVYLDTPWWICSLRAVVRSVRPRPRGFQLPAGCTETLLSRTRAEWSLAGRIWRVRNSDRERELRIISRHASHLRTYVLRSRREVNAFLDA